LQEFGEALQWMLDLAVTAECVWGGWAWSRRVKVGSRFNKGNGHLSKQEQKVPLSTGRNEDNTLPNDAVLEDKDTLDRGRRRVTNENGDERASYR
jgi:hypothetical protein